LLCFKFSSIQIYFLKHGLHLGFGAALAGFWLLFLFIKKSIENYIIIILGNVA